MIIGDLWRTGACCWPARWADEGLHCQKRPSRSRYCITDKEKGR